MKDDKIKKDKKANNIGAVIELCLAVMLLATVIIGYAPTPNDLVELTAVSNFGIGLLMLISAILRLLNKKRLPNVVYLTALATIMIVFLICMVSLTGIFTMNFSGAFLFLHVVNPLSVMAYYLIFTDENNFGEICSIFIAPLFCLLYLLIDYVVGKSVGQFVYGFFKPEELNFGYALLVGVVIYVGLLAVSALMFLLNKLIHKSVYGNRDKNTNQ